MTTGRINQVTTFPVTPNTRTCPRKVGVRLSDFNTFQNPRSGNCSHKEHATEFLNRGLKPALFPVLTFIQTHCFLFIMTRMIVFREELPATSKNNCCCSLGRGGFPTALIATSLAHQQVSPHPSFLASTKNKCLTSNNQAQSPFQISMSCNLQKQHHWFGREQASQTPSQQKQRHTELSIS